MRFMFQIFHQGVVPQNYGIFCSFPFFAFFVCVCSCYCRVSAWTELNRTDQLTFLHDSWPIPSWQESRHSKPRIGCVAARWCQKHIARHACQSVGSQRFGNLPEEWKGVLAGSRGTNAQRSRQPQETEILHSPATASWLLHKTLEMLG